MNRKNLDRSVVYYTVGHFFFSKDEKGDPVPTFTVDSRSRYYRCGLHPPHPPQLENTTARGGGRGGRLIQQYLLRRRGVYHTSIAGSDRGLGEESGGEDAKPMVAGV